MATKSVIEIDVLDEKFQAFKKEFDRYQSALAKMPADWNKVGGALTNFDKKQKDLNKSLKEGNQSLKEAAGHTANIAKNLASSVLSIGKWLALGATVGGFGLGGLASSASDYRRRAQGVGATTGQLRAAEVTLGRYIDPSSVLGNIANIQSDLSRAPILGRLGAQQGVNGAENLPNIIRQTVAAFKQGGGTKQYAEAMGLTDVFSMEELRRLSSLSREELESTIEAYKKAQKALDVSDTQARNWQDFWYKVKEAGQKIEVAFINGLTPLIPQLKALSETIAEGIENFLKSDEVRKSLEEFNNYLKSPEFKQNITDFFEGVKNLGESAYNAAKFLGLIKDKDAPTPAQVESEKGKLPFWGRGMAHDVVARRNVNERKAYDFYRSSGLSHAAAIGMVANLSQESSMFEGAVGPGNHVGLAQWDATRQAEFKQVMGKSVLGSSFEDQLKFSMYEFQHKENKAYSQLKNAATIREGVVAGMAYERPATMGTPGYEREVNIRSRIADQISVRIDNATGGNATATVNATAGAGR